MTEETSLLVWVCVFSPMFLGLMEQCGVHATSASHIDCVCVRPRPHTYIVVRVCTSVYQCVPVCTSVYQCLCGCGCVQSHPMFLVLMEQCVVFMQPVCVYQVCTQSPRL